MHQDQIAGVRASEVATEAIFAHLIGTWNLDRKIEGIGVMVGNVEILRISNRILAYNEHGTFRLDSGREFTAFRSLFYCWEHNDIVVRFQQIPAEADVLHRLRIRPAGDDPWPAEGYDVHHCGQDTYRGLYRFEAPDRFTIQIEVLGPHKNALIDTELTKASCPIDKRSIPTVSRITSRSE